ncbi:MAG: hypothetical protein HC828_06055 [Blastochloris sp.]|nr:hypothetical protein [Blastochloris sp.]
MNLYAIPTTYQGYRFRSRIEARWAVFFDALGIRWVYEPEGWNLPPYAFDKVEWIRAQSKHTRDLNTLKLLHKTADDLSNMANSWLRYLPDFYLKDCNAWAEVKPKGTIDGYDKMVRLVCQSNKQMLVLRELDESVLVLSPLDVQRNLVTIDAFDFCVPGTLIAQANAAARSAQFEHGEQRRVVRGKRS